MDEAHTPVVAPQRSKSPPLAFQPTCNDSLWSPLHHASSGSSTVRSPTASQLSDILVSASEMEMQIQIEKLAEALRLQSKAFAAERDSWQLEKDRLYRRISSLESLLRGTENGHSPAKSPLTSPHSGNTLTSPHSGNTLTSPHSANACTPPQPRSSTSLTNSRLASIAEVEPPSPLHENRRPLPHLKRDSAPMTIDLPPRPAVATVFDPLDTTMDDRRASDMLDDIDVEPALVDEVPPSPPQSRLPLSPPPPANLHHAGHTPIRTGSPAPSNLGGHLDTPTRSNTVLNELLKDHGDGERPLKGPLMLPELPQAPDKENFTMTMLDAKLQDLIEHPEDSEPVVCKMTHPAIEVADEADLVTEPADSKTAVQQQASGSKPDSLSASKAASLTASLAVSPSVVRVEDPLDGGITLRSKPSTNFGAPLGQMNPMWKH